MTRLDGKILKGWGHELIWCTNDKYCGKILSFKEGGMFSMHFHAQKDETWYVQSGVFEVRFINTGNASITKLTLRQGDVWHNPPLLPHQIVCLEAGDIIEVSTPDSVEDNYRVMPGNSQGHVEDNS